jgi:hypothetical protein
MTCVILLRVVVGLVMMLFLQFVCCSRIAQLWMRVLSPVLAAAFFAQPKQVSMLKPVDVKISWFILNEGRN